MKIAFAFVLVGLTFYASADAKGLKQCPGKLTKCQGETLAAFVVALIYKYENVKKSGKDFTCDEECLIESGFMITKMLAEYKKCSEEILINEVLECLKIDIALKKKVREAFFKNNATIAMNASVHVSGTENFAALCCMMKKLYDADGLNLLVLLNGALSSMTPLLGGLLGNVAGVLSGALGVALQLVGDVVVLVEELHNGVLGAVGGTAHEVASGVLNKHG